MIENYYLITIKSNDAFYNTFVEKGTSVYNAFLNKIENSKGNNGFIYSVFNSIVFAQQATENDFEMYVKTRAL